MKNINKQLKEILYSSFIKKQISEIDVKKWEFHMNKTPRYENDGYPPDTNTQHYHVTYPAECWGCGYKKGGRKCPYCGTY